jgi:malate/lactate dehydrogenase
MRKKVTVVGGGFVGSTTAQRIVDKELADVVLTDILDGPPAGKALDMMESGPITRSDSRAIGISTANGDYSATAGSDVVVITAGFPRKPGMSRDDLLKALAELHHHRGDEPARCDGASGVEGERISEKPRARHGRRAGFRAHEHVCGDGVQG